MNQPRLVGLRLACVAGTIALTFASPTRAATVDFETTPAGVVPVDNTALTGAYAISGGGTVAFYFDVDGNNAFDAATDLRPVFEKVGNSDPDNGFYNTGLAAYDVPKAGFAAQLGQFFLRQPTSLGAVPAPFVIDYDTTQHITALSGEIWDIDGASATSTERWQLDVLDAAGRRLASGLSPTGTEQAGPYDGAPWTFSFDGLPAGVDKLRLTYIGTKPGSIGLAFNNFSPTTAALVPEPASGTLALLGLGALAAAARRARARRA